MNDAPGPGGWHPDPTGRFEHRWWNGERWTADVSTGGRRFVDPGGPATYQPGWGPLPPTAGQPAKGMAVASFVVAMVSLLLAWMPFVFVFAAAGAVVAFVLGIVGMRRATGPDGVGRGFAVAGIVVAIGAAALCVVGGWLTVLLWQELKELSEAGPHSATIESCAHEGRLVEATGMITNGDDRTRSYIVVVRFTNTDGDILDLSSVSVDNVGAGRSEEFSTTSFVDRDVDVECAIEEVRGPGFFEIPES